ncbi:hypothetical protein HanHA300_Chr10g0351081 [Helianthus annuus]|nr:hypothetical protein HanHA300_Chr10g0351081 [Helianthus annuus]KAJ0520570.1 hypothetical protein HanIR_Chr10g0460861 [Helianthus annuus]KAJ0528998.1 hypothetical protein HanHA89_Chr10g0372751 [Helianthus annuus]KAJ0695914.1 hypothetical protein HanLR1_Chr10g0350971 [Helianthus annuus]
MCDLFYWLVVTILEDRRRGLEEVGRGGKTLDHVCVGKRTRRGLKTFFNEMSSKKQTVCLVQARCAWIATNKSHGCSHAWFVTPISQ